MHREVSVEMKNDFTRIYRTETKDMGQYYLNKTEEVWIQLILGIWFFNF
jgi:hypothetical protein